MQIMKTGSIGVAIVAAGLFGAIASANAAYIQGTCALTDVTAGGQAASACRNYSGNDTGYESLIAADFGVSGPWDLAGKSDAPNDFVLDIGGGAQSGNWAVDGSIDALFVVVLKAANFFAAYLFDSVTGVTDGTYDVSGITTKVGHNGQIKSGHAGLSHLSLYDGPDVVTTGSGNSIGESAALGLFGLALAGLAGAGMRCRIA